MNMPLDREETGATFDEVGRRSTSMNRIFVIGNAGSGKTWLATRLATRLAAARDLPLTRLDDLRWEPGRVGLARREETIRAELAQRACEPAWIMEGVYGWMLTAVLPKVDALVWLDPPRVECMANLHARGE
jgi:adenylate kinase family enzyme